MGYAGGTTPAPTYSDIGDHTETVQVDYAPQVITYDQLLDIFWKSHNPMSRTWSRQYLNAVFYHDENQRAQAEASQEALAKKRGRKIKTAVAPLNSFTPAENYHQKFNLKNSAALNREMTRIYPKHTDYIESTAVARLNGYAGGNGTRAQLDTDIERLGLSESGRQTLREIVAH